MVTVSPSTFIRDIEALSGEKVSTCFQCQKCSNGCPATIAMEIAPHRLIHMMQLGLRDQVLRSNTAWVCAACETCTARCPNDIDIAHVLDIVRQMSERAGARPDLQDTVRFHSAFLSSVRRHGKVFELGMMADYKLRTRNLFQDIGLALSLLRKGKLKLLPRRLSAGRPVKDIFRRTEKAGR